LYITIPLDNGALWNQL